MSLGPLYVLLGEVFVQVLCLFLNLTVHLPGVEPYEFFIYVEDQTLVLGVIDKYIFPYSWFPWHLADGFFSHAEAFYFMWSHLFILSFMSLALGNITAVWDI